MKLLHVSSGEIFGGIETVLVSLAGNGECRPQLEQGFALCFEGRLNSELRALEVPVHMLGETRFGRPWSVLKGRKALRDVIERCGYDAVICHGTRTMILFAAAVREMKKPLVFWVHGLKPRNHWLSVWLRLLPPDFAICNSRFTKHNFRRLFPGVEAEVVYHPLKMTGFSMSAAGRAAVRKEFGASAEEAVVVHVSRMVPWKGHRTLIRSLSRLDPGLPWRCWIAGGAQSRTEERYLKALRSTVQRKGLRDRIRFLGQRNDVAKILAAADIFCQSNQKAEAFGVVYIEAMLAGIPIVTSAMGAAAEVIDPETGILLPSNDPEALELALTKLLSDPVLRRRLGSQGPARARLLCEPGARLEQLQEILERRVIRHQSPSNE